jgi:hypothetical protein
MSACSNELSTHMTRRRSHFTAARAQARAAPVATVKRSGAGEHCGCACRNRDRKASEPARARAHGTAVRASVRQGLVRPKSKSLGVMNKRARLFRAIFRGMTRVQKSFTIEIGPLRASGVPAILVGVTGIVLASGITAALAKSAPRLPETLGEARGLAEALNARAPRLPS